MNSLESASYIIRITSSQYFKKFSNIILSIYATLKLILGTRFQYSAAKRMLNSAHYRLDHFTWQANWLRLMFNGGHQCLVVLNHQVILLPNSETKKKKECYEDKYTLQISML
jgi:hypothetical protein